MPVSLCSEHARFEVPGGLQWSSKKMGMGIPFCGICIHVICVCLCMFTCIHIFRHAGRGVRCLFQSFSTLSKLGLLNPEFVHSASLASQVAVKILCLRLPGAVTRSGPPCLTNSVWSLGIWTLLHKLAWQAVCPLRHLPILGNEDENLLA